LKPGFFAATFLSMNLPMVLAAVEGLMLMTRTQRSAAPLKRGLPVLQLLLRVH